MNYYILVLLACFSLSSALVQARSLLPEDASDNNLEELVIEQEFLHNNLKPVLLNQDSIHDFAEFSIVFEGVMYEPYEYITYFQAGFEAELYLIAEGDILYAYSTVEEAVSHIIDSSINEKVASQSYLRKGQKGCEKPYNTYIHWEGLGGWNPHYAYSFHYVPKNHQGYLVDIRYCAKSAWKTKWIRAVPIPIRYCKKYGTKDIAVYAPDHVSGKPNDIMFQKRDIIWYCYGSNTICLKHVRVCKG